MGKMPIVVDETEPVGEIEPPFESRDVQIKRGLNVRDYFAMEEEIGRGKFGTVFKCREKSTGLRLAAKFVQAAKKADRANVEREVEIMKSLRNPRLIQLYDAYDDGKREICLLLELIEGGELFERVIDDDFVLTERACAIFMRQICEGIQFIHLQHVLHLDMKPENILCLTREGNRIKLIDFGLARRYDPSKKLQVLFGTPEFVAPEVVNFESIGYGTDMWSVGIICYVLLSGLSPFMGETDVETMANVTIAKYDFDDEAFNDVSAEAKDFISKLLVKQISKRMTATECLRHPWLRIRPPLPSKEPLPPAEQEESEAEESEEEDDEETEDEESLESAPQHPVNGTIEAPVLNGPSKADGDVQAVNDAEPAQSDVQIEAKPDVTPEVDARTEVLQEQAIIKADTLKSDQTLSDNEEKSADKENKPIIPVAMREPKKEGGKFKTPLSNSQATEEEVLQLTKVNLRQFVERWNSHPNSPFQACSESPRRTISLLISSPVPPEAADSPSSMAAMSPSPPESPGSPRKEGPVAETEVGPLKSPSKATTTSVESAIEQTSALLRSVKESLIRQIESGTAVRDRTGARVWERKGSGLIASSPSLTPKRWNLTPAPSVDVSCNNNNNTNINNNMKVPVIQQPDAPAKAANPQPNQQPPPQQNTLEPPNVKKVVRQASTEGEWEEHQPVAAKSFGFAKRHVIIDASRTVVTSNLSATSTSTSSFSLTSATSQIIHRESHKP